MGASNPKPAAQTQKISAPQPAQAVVADPKAIDQALANTQPLQKVEAKPELPESQQVQSNVNVAPGQDASMRNMFKQRQDQTGYEDVFSKVDVTKKTKQQEQPAQQVAFKKEPSKVQQDPLQASNADMNKDTVEPINFKAAQQQQKKDAFANMSATMKKKMEVLLNKRLEKGIERMRAQTPDTVMKIAYEDVLEGPLLVDYLKAQQFFKDEADEQEDEQYMGELKMANDQVSPLRWDSFTVVQDVFRVLQDLTPYVYDFIGQGVMGQFNELADAKPENGQELPLLDNVNKDLPIGIRDNKLVNKQNMLGTLSGQGGREFYNTSKLYDANMNKNLADPPVIAPPKQGKALMTLRVEMKKTMSTAILKVPSGVYFNKQIFMNQMQQWSSIPYNKRLVRPLCFASLNQDIPLVFVEDVPFSLSLEDVVLDRTFYKGVKYRFEIAHKILACIIQVIETIDHAHQFGVMHFNIHAGNILTPKCAQRDQSIGFFVTDFGDPVMLQEETVWTDMHEKTFQRMMRFYPPNILSLIKHIANSTDDQSKRELLRQLAQAQNILIDVYSVGVMLFFMICGSYEWKTTRDINAMFDAKILAAESIIDLVSLRVIKNTIKKCLLLDPKEEPVDRISELLPSLIAARDNCEKILKQNSIGFYTYDKLYKSFYEYLPGQRKENLFNPDIDILMQKDLVQYESEIFQHRMRALYLHSLDPKSGHEPLTPQQVREKLKIEKQHKQPDINDEDTESNILNNQAVLAYQKQDYQRCIELFIANQDQFMANPISCFNFLILCWEAGIYSDEFILNELTKITVNPYTGRQFSSYFYGLIYESQNNWQAAKTNFGLAYQSASDGIVCSMKARYENAKYMNDNYPESFLFGHLEISDVSDIVISYHGKFAASFQKTSRIIIWNLHTQKILKEIEDKNATCMDASSKLDRIVVGLRSGLIVMFNLLFENDQVVNVDEVELGFHTNTILQIKLSKDGYHGLSGGVDQYIALWNCSKKLLLSKIEIPGQFMRCCAINMNGEDFMFATSGSYHVQVYHHSLGKKTILPTFTLEKHQAQVTSVDMAYDGLLGVSAGQDRMVYLWDLLRGDCIRQIQLQSFIQKVSLTPMGKFLAMTQLDGSLSLYETITGVTWRSEEIDGKHSGVAVIANNFILEVMREGVEHKMMALLEFHKERLQREFYDARGIGENTFQETASPSQNQSPLQNNTSPKKNNENPFAGRQGSNTKMRTQAPMPVVVEADPEEESDYRRTTLRTTQRKEEANQTVKPLSEQGLIGIDEEDIHDVNMLDELMLQDLFFENPVFKFLYFQNDDFTKRISYKDLQSELGTINFDRAKDPYAKNTYLLKNSLEQIEVSTNFNSFERGLFNYRILQERRRKFDVNAFRTQKQLQLIREQQSLCKLLVIAGEAKRGEDSFITQQGSIVGLRYQQINLPFLGMGPCQMINHADVRNCQDNYIVIQKYSIQNSNESKRNAVKGDRSL